ncbi:hypothetical protein Patl1_00802 [Pistacia atlantica]|uniref:Uncharacterized protein n=1 Tax=Pistacia atlantica TaxID=434234 RepID=A0ACC1C4G3_9ROSI|nr:hypothetical protein Patl1_00802 [Pistacia atlantica]
MELAEIGRSSKSFFHEHTSSSFRNALDAEYIEENHDEVELLWAAIERLPTNKRLRISLFDHKLLKDGKEEEGKTMIDVSKLGDLERHVFIDKLLMKIEEDNHRLLQKLKERIENSSWSGIANYGSQISELVSRGRICVDICAQAGKHLPHQNIILWKKLSREKQNGIIPEPDIDTYMKGLKRTLQTDYIIKILGLDICANTVVGDAMNRGISGGQKKRLTIGERIIGPTRALFMDKISNGLDSSTTFQIVTSLQQLAHITYSTILISLLQPALETFNLFDDIILMAEGKIVYHGPCSNVLEFFEHCGFKCPPRKRVAGFLQEVELSLTVSRLIVVYKQRDFMGMFHSICSFKSSHFNARHFFIDSPLLIMLLGTVLNQRDFIFRYYPWTSSSHQTWTELQWLFLLDFSWSITWILGMVLPFEPITLTFENVQYFVDTSKEFVAEVLQLIELDEIKDSLVGIPGISGLSDARAGAIVMRVVKNIVQIARTVYAPFTGQVSTYLRQLMR